MAYPSSFEPPQVRRQTRRRSKQDKAVVSSSPSPDGNIERNSRRSSRGFAQLLIHSRSSRSNFDNECISVSSGSSCSSSSTVSSRSSSGSSSNSSSVGSVSTTQDFIRNLTGINSVIACPRTTAAQKAKEDAQAKVDDENNSKDRLVLQDSTIKATNAVAATSREGGTAPYERRMISSKRIEVEYIEPEDQQIIEPENPSVADDADSNGDSSGNGERRRSGVISSISNIFFSKTARKAKASPPQLPPPPVQSNHDATSPVILDSVSQSKSESENDDMVPVKKTRRGKRDKMPPPAAAAS